MSILVKVNTKAPQAKMHPNAARRFDQLRQVVAIGSGIDFLALCGDVLRDPDFVSSKDGVAKRSWHKTGRAFDYDQTSNRLVLVSEVIGGKQYFRTYLKCANQSGALGKFKTVKDKRGVSIAAYLYDFTAAAEELGFKRIPAWKGWQTHYNRQEFWHYQFDEGLSWDAAMLQLRGKSRPAAATVYGLNDRGDEVKRIQAQLAKRGFLPPHEVDGVFGAKTKEALEGFQRASKLSIDGICGEQTAAKLFAEYR